MTTVPKLLINPWTIRMPKFITDCWMQVRKAYWKISRRICRFILMYRRSGRKAGNLIKV